MPDDRLAVGHVVRDEEGAPLEQLLPAGQRIERDVGEQHDSQLHFVVEQHDTGRRRHGSVGRGRLGGLREQEDVAAARLLGVARVVEPGCDDHALLRVELRLREHDGRADLRRRLLGNELDDLGIAGNGWLALATTRARSASRASSATRVGMPPAASSTRAQRTSPAGERTRATRGSGCSSMQRARSLAPAAAGRGAASNSTAMARDREGSTRQR